MKLLISVLIGAALTHAFADPGAGSTPFGRPKTVEGFAALPPPRRSPFVDSQAALLRATAFLREHKPMAAHYHIAGVHWFSQSPDANDDCWVVDWAVNDDAKPAAERVLIFRDHDSYG